MALHNNARDPHCVTQAFRLTFPSYKLLLYDGNVMIVFAILIFEKKKKKKSNNLSLIVSAIGIVHTREKLRFA